ncbi:type 1 glutamine amidotransferase domain-containing protein [Leptothoe sp. ISB3NOV94-8A]|uniref:Type 1 glutamine amidotransferase domain-containing protein n=1 Tax=Adonisia turfae CCMR0081 TaxID=2292702 RepID=A0A6M0RRT3_9CYAN|nr:type 1 glutamine amidotransferase domain-containing protein [Adonisia turfae]NEZ58482.1 type 1 glutamine amidotransferase domain-containing protein [Adonisia turfae CCMR0081]
MANPRILIVLTSHDQLGDTGHATGFWLEELACPYYTFLDADATVTLASIQGGQAPLDPKSHLEESQTDDTRRFIADSAAQIALANTLAIDQVDAGDYDAIFMPGGHGTMWDFATSSTLSNLIEAFDEEEKIIAAVCHAPAGLVNVKTSAGEPLIKGKVVTAFSNSEEKAVALDTVVPFLLETRLRELGAIFEAGPDWGAFAKQDGNLITGQNPASSEPAAQAVLAALK